MTTRRDFLVSSATIASAVAASRALGQPIEIVQPPPQGTALAEELALEALNAAKSAGASYADARVGRYRRQQISTRERSISGVSDSESYGVGVRTLVNGSWGFAATSEMTKDGVAKSGARGSASFARREDGAATSGRTRPGGGGKGHVDDADQARSDRRPDRRKGRTAAGHERGGAEGASRSLRDLRSPVAARGEDARDH